MFILTKKEDRKFMKTGSTFHWVKRKKDKTFHSTQPTPKAGYSLIIDAYSGAEFTFQTNIIVEIVESTSDYIIFKTKESQYKLLY